MYLSLCALLLSAPLAPAQDAIADLGAAREEALLAWTNDHVEQSLTVLADSIKNGAAQLGESPAGDEASLLAAELEYSLIRLQALAGSTRNPKYVAELLEGIVISPEYGGAHARLAWLYEDCTDKLGALVDWQIVGPFDNERGAGMETALAPMANPNEEIYAGKLRAVSWRRSPQQAPRKGRMRFLELLDPTTQICVFARSWISSPEEATHLLQLGFEDEVRVWLNGTQVFEALGEHAFAKDSIAVELQLNAGWNELMVLVGSRDGSPSFTARMTDRKTGAPLSLRSTGHLPSGIRPAVLSPDSPESAERVTPPGARKLLGRGDTAGDLLVRSHLESFFQGAPAKSRPGRASAASAVELDPTNLAARVQHTLTLQDSDRSEEQDVNPWLHSIDEFLELRPNSAWAWRLKAFHAGWNQPTYRRALDHIERALEANPASVQAQELHILLLEYLEQEAVANRMRAELLEHPSIALWPSVAATCASCLPEADSKRLQIALDWFHATGNAQALSDWLWRSSRTRDARDVSGIENVLALRTSRTPWSVDARIEAAHAHITLGNAERALELVEEVEALSPDYATAQYWRARAHMLLGETDRAIVALERELELDYSAEDERRLLEHLRSSGAAPFHEEYREPLLDIVQRVIVDPDAAAQLPSREVILKRVVVKVSPDGTAQRYFRIVERILSETGARDRDAIRFSSFPNQEIRVLLADVYSGGQVSHARTGRTAGRMLVDLPPLNVGDVIDLEWRLDDTRPTFFGSYFGFNETFSPDPSVPVYESEIVILTPDDFPLQFHTRGEVEEPEVDTTEAGLTRRRWITKAILPVEPERFMPPLEETMAAVQATSYPSWEAFGAWWWNLTEEEIRVSPEMATKVAELTSGKETTLAQLRAIYDFVVTDIRYNAWEFGVHGYQPYEAPVIFSRGFGDCKDKAILLRAMLSEVDIEAWPVLIRAEQRRPDEDQELALVEHFNHCIAFIPEQEGIPEMFLDGTARHHPLEVLPAMDHGAKVLIVREDGVEQRTIPIAPASENHIDTSFNIRISADKSAQVTMHRKTAGRYDPADRGRFTGSDEQRTEQAERIAVGLFGPIEGEVATKFSNLENLSEPVSIELEVQAKQLARPNDEGFELPTALSKLDLLETLAGEAERKTDLLIDVPRSNTSKIRYDLPPGSNPREVPAPVHVECAEASYDWSAEIVEGGFEIREEFSLKTNRIPAASYSAFRDLARKVDEAQNAVLEVEVKP